MTVDCGSIGEIQVTSFFGGIDRGVCVQLTSDTGYVQLDMYQQAELCNLLGGLIEKEAVRRQNLLKQQIAELNNIQKTVFNEIAELSTDLFKARELSVLLVDKFCPKSEAQLIRGEQTK